MIRCRRQSTTHRTHTAPSIPSNSTILDIGWTPQSAKIVPRTVVVRASRRRFCYSRSRELSQRRQGRTEAVVFAPLGAGGGSKTALLPDRGRSSKCTSLTKRFVCTLDTISHLWSSCAGEIFSWMSSPLCTLKSEVRVCDFTSTQSPFHGAGCVPLHGICSLEI